MTTVERIKAESLNLPRSDRLDLANDLLESFVEESRSEPDDAFLTELERRSNAVKAGTLSIRSVDDIMAGLKTRFDKP